MATALLLAQSGEFAMVLFALARGEGLLDLLLFQGLLVVVLLSMLVTPVLDRVAFRIVSATSRTAADVTSVQPGGVSGGDPPVVLAGFGRMGHRIAHIMDMMKVPYVAIDTNPVVVERERAQGKPVYFGGAQKLEVLRAAGVADAPFVVVAIDDLIGAERVVSSLHSALPGTPIYARAHDLFRCRHLRRAGARFTVSETLEASAELARAALLDMGADDSEVEIVLERFRKEYYSRGEGDSHGEPPR